MKILDNLPAVKMPAHGHNIDVMPTVATYLLAQPAGGSTSSESFGRLSAHHFIPPDEIAQA
ncbi:MAG: hypothetical protein ACR2O1_09555, partial [Boseongicola sp.]